MRYFLVFGLMLAAAAATAQDATYTLRFDATWTAQTHPLNYPPQPHFSGLVGGTHDATADFWEDGQLASLGMRRMAEWGSQTELLAEVDAALGTGQAGMTVAAAPLWVVPGGISIDFTVTDAHPLATIVTMLAPSPDWFVGVDGLDLRDGVGGWQDKVVVDLYVWDAGTDSGANYTSGDLVTSPPDPITAKGAPFEPGVPVGTFTFTLQGVSGVPDVDAMDLRVWPNPFNPRTTVAWSLPADGPLKVEVFDLAGRRVRILRDGPAQAGPGSVAWDGRDDSGRPLAASVYLVRLATREFESRRRVTLVK